MKGDIIDYNNSDIFLNLKPGSIVRIIDTINQYESDEVIGFLIMRGTFYNQHGSSYHGIAIYHPNNEGLCSLWGNSWENYKFEIIKEV